MAARAQESRGRGLGGPMIPGSRALGPRGPIISRHEAAAAIIPGFRARGKIRIFMWRHFFIYLFTYLNIYLE
jgi:hypothetical protein